MSTKDIVIVIVALTLGFIFASLAIDVGKASLDYILETRIEAISYDTFYNGDYYYQRDPSYRQAERIAKDNNATLDLNIMGGSAILTIPEWMSQGTDTACIEAGQLIYSILSVLPENFLIYIVPTKGGDFVPSRENPVDLDWARQLAGIGDPDWDQYPDSLKAKMINY